MMVRCFAYICVLRCWTSKFEQWQPLQCLCLSSGPWCRVSLKSCKSAFGAQTLSGILQGTQWKACLHQKSGGARFLHHVQDGLDSIIVALSILQTLAIYSITNIFSEILHGVSSLVVWMQVREVGKESLLETCVPSCCTWRLAVQFLTGID